MYTLYWCPAAASLAPMAILEELGADYELKLVDMSKGEHRSPEYLRVHPYGQVPALGLPEGRATFGSVAVGAYLCDRHRSPELAPPPDAGSRAQYLHWMLFVADTVLPACHRFARPERYSIDLEDAPRVKSRASQDLLEQWAVLDEALARAGPWLLGDRLSACDFYVYMASAWQGPAGGLAGRYPCLARLAAGLEERASLGRALELHEQ